MYLRSVFVKYLWNKCKQENDRINNYIGFLRKISENKGFINILYKKDKEYRFVIDK